MADTRDKLGRAGVFLAGGVFKIALYICVIVFLIWVGKSTYQCWARLPATTPF